LACYGVAQPLAEELLGAVLRATLRGDPGVFYLADRGADARPALRRLRADLDAVRGAVANTLATAHAAAVRESRLAVLNQFRGRLQQRAVQVSPPRSDPTHRLVFPALDLGAAGDGHCISELAFLSPLSGQPSSVLDQWEQELSGQERENLAAGGSWAFLLRYCRVVDPRSPAAFQFLALHSDLTKNVLYRGSPVDSAQAEDRERVRRWVDDYQPLAERLECGPRFVEFFREFGQNLKEKLLTPWGRGLRGRHFFLFRRQVVRVPLTRAERLAIRDEELRNALEGISAAVQQSLLARRERAADFAGALAQWRALCLGHSWLDNLGRLEAEALGQRKDLEARCDAWYEEWSQTSHWLRDWLTKTDALLKPYAPLLSADSVADEVSARLTRVQREALDRSGIEAAIAWLERNWPAPSETVEALFALWELGIEVRS
jgi:hypothetical protein